MSRIASSVGAVLLCLSAACGTDASDEGRSASGSASPAPSPAASPTRGAVEAGSTTTASPGCVDSAGDSAGGPDLTSLAVDLSEDQVLFVYTYQGAIPQSGTLLLSTVSGERQYGYKTVDGKESSHFVFDFSDAEQESIDAEAVVRPTEATISFPRSAVDVEALREGTAALNVDGQDVDDCRLSTPD